tara:strand:+ start:11147 stop:12031 length:885 start_codon:yes stop_codon:yes gene_type:complete
MAQQYKPGSKYKVQRTLGGEYCFLDDGREYVGEYIIMSDGTFFAGNEISKLGFELIKLEDKPNRKGKTISANRFNILKENYFEFISQTKTIVPTKNFPTKSDYMRGFYERYFVKRKNEPLNYKEIDKETYDSLKNKKTEYDWRLHDCGKIIWVLNGEANTANAKSLEIAERKFKGLGIIFQNTEEFYLPRSITDPEPQTVAIAKDKEPSIFRNTRESNPASQKEVKTPALQKVHDEMLRDVQIKHRKKQDAIKQEIADIDTQEETRLEQLRNTAGRGASGGTSGGGSSSGGGGY